MCSTSKQINTADSINCMKFLSFYAKHLDTKKQWFDQTLISAENGYSPLKLIALIAGDHHQYLEIMSIAHV